MKKTFKFRIIKAFNFEKHQQNIIPLFSSYNSDAKQLKNCKRRLQDRLFAYHYITYGVCYWNSSKIIIPSKENFSISNNSQTSHTTQTSYNDNNPSKNNTQQTPTHKLANFPHNLLEFPEIPQRLRPSY